MFWRAVARDDKNAPRASVFDRSQTTHAAGLIEGVSFSGNERNSLMLNVGAQHFEEISGISGFDDPADGRALGLLDYDHDGWLDFALVNANAPLLQLFRNRIGEIAPATSERNVLAVRFVGGNRKAAPAEGLSARDGYGAVVEVELKDATLVREHRASEGFANQNSATLLIGLGEGVEFARLSVRWPSGSVQQLAKAPANSVVTIYEDADESPNDSGFHIAPYRVYGLAAQAAAKPRRSVASPKLRIAQDGRPGGSKPQLRLLTTMATWCDTCKGELPQLAHLRSEFGDAELAMQGLPVDEDDDRGKLDAYALEYAPAYELQRELDGRQRSAITDAVLAGLRVDVMPASIITDAEGRVLKTVKGVPTLSEIRALLMEDT